MASNPDPHVLIRFQEVIDALQARASENLIEPSLSRMEYLLDLLGSPQVSYEVVHVAGTNGKTTTSRMIEGLLAESGLTVGLTTSPHLHDLRERIRLHREPISVPDFVSAYDDIEPYLAMTDEAVGRLSYFEALTALALAAFADAPVSAAVVEVGLGGRWDATNLVAPSVAVITPIGLDHQQYLGETIEEIAAEKAGIIKPGMVVLTAPQLPAVMDIIKLQAQEVGAALLVQGVDFGVVERAMAVGGQMVAIRGLGGVYPDIVLPLHGAHQADNAALALAAAEAFFGAGVDGRALDLDLVHQAFGRVTSPGRLEVVRRGPTVLVDAAHNPHGTAALVTALAEEFTFDRLVFVYAAFADKDVAGSLGLIEPIADHLICTQSSSPRALPAVGVADIAREVFDTDQVEVVERLPDAIARAVEIADAWAEEELSGGIVVTGSVFTAAEGRALLGRRTAT